MLQIVAEGFSVSDVTVLLIVTFILLLLTAITAGAEAAFFSLNAREVHYLKARDQPNARLVIQLLEQPRVLLATLVVAGTFINITIIFTANQLIGKILADMDASISAAGTLAIKVLVISFLLLMFGSIMPRVYATRNITRMVLFAAPFISILLRLFQPISRLLVSTTSYFEERLTTKPVDVFNTGNFAEIIESTVGHAATKEEVDIFKGILKFGNISVRQIMRTRLDVSAVPFDFSFPELQQFAIQAGYSRIPVYRKNLDEIVGMIHTKDFLAHAEEAGFDWHGLIRPAYFVHEGKRIEDLLHEFRQHRIHFAIVADEFGGTSGIVTLEDIMEEIIGDIRDEFDEDDIAFTKLDEQNYIFNGKTMINDVCRIIGIPTDSFESVRGESDSLAGLMMEISGRFSAINETIIWQQFEFTALEVDRMRITRIKLAIHDLNDESE